MSKPKAPPPPDPYQTANAQTQANQKAAEYNAALNRVNTYTPFGSQTFDITGYDRRTGAPIYEQNISLSPEQQALYDQEMWGQWNLNDTANSMLGGIKSQYGQPMDTSGLPQLQGAPDMSGAPQVQSGFSFGGPQMSFQGANPQMSLAQMPGPQTGFQGVGPQMSLMQGQGPQTSFQGVGPQMSFQGTGPQMQLNTSGLPNLPGSGDLAGFRQQSQDALYNRNTEYLDPQFQRGEDALRTRLANQGIVEGSEAYRNAMDDFSRSKETAYRQARNEAIAGGGAEAERMFGIGSQARGQLYGEALTSGDFSNQAARQASDLAMAQGQFANQAANQASNLALAQGQFANQAQAQQFGQNLAAADFGNQAARQASDLAMAQGQFANQAQAQQFGQNLAAADFSNQARQQMLAEQLAGGQFTNQARAQGMQEQMALRNQPLNEYNALMAGSQVSLPNFQGMYNAQAGPADVQGNVWNSYGAQTDAYNARMQSRNAMLQGLFGLGGTLGGAALMGG